MKKAIMAVLMALLVIGMVSTVYGAESGKEWANNQVDGPIRARDGSCQDTLLGGISLSGLEAENGNEYAYDVGEPIRDRLRDGSCCV